MVCLAQKAFEPELKKIWKICFSDSDAYIDCFFQKQMKPENTLVYTNEQDVPVAMLFLLPAELHLKENNYPLQYLYAACTLPEFRGRGYMEQLVNAASELGKERGIERTALVPAEESLFQYYEKCGYQRFFQRKKFVLSREELMVYDTGNCKKIPVSVSNIIKQRNLYLQQSNNVSWPANHIRYAAGEAFAVGGGVLCSDLGYAFYKVSNDILTINELAVNPKDFSAFSGLLLREFPFETFIFHVTTDWQPLEGIFCNKYWYGMLRYEGDNQEPALEAGAYLSLALD